jgi:membrane-associated phospholipid phosphatase
MDRVLRRPLLLAAGCAVLFGLVLLAAYVPARGRWLDGAGLAGFVDLQSPFVADLTGRVARLGDPLPVGLAGGMLAAVALARGRSRLASGVILLLAATSVSSQLLKLGLAHPRYHESIPAGGQVAPAAFPSGHATAAMSLALAGVLAVPRRVRPVAALLGAALAVAVGFSVVSLGWHFPSDVIGGYLLATGWALALVAVLRRAPGEQARSARSEAAPARARSGPVGGGWLGSGRARSDQAESPTPGAAPKRARSGQAGSAWPGSGRTRSGLPRSTRARSPLELWLAAATALAALAILALAAANLPGAHDFPRDHTAFLAVAAGLAMAALALPAGVAAALRRT